MDSPAIANSFCSLGLKGCAIETGKEMGNGHVNERETKAHKCLKSHPKVIKQILLRPWRPKRAFRPRPQKASWLPGSLRQSPMSTKQGDMEAWVQGRCCPSSSLGPLGGGAACPNRLRLGGTQVTGSPGGGGGEAACPNRLGVGRTQVTRSPWRRPRVLKRRSSKPRACPPPGSHS